MVTLVDNLDTPLLMQRWNRGRDENGQPRSARPQSLSDRADRHLIALRDTLLAQFDPDGVPQPYSSPTFEPAAPIGEPARRALIDRMLALPPETARALFRTSPSLQYVSENAATHRALDRLYAGPLPEEWAGDRRWSRLIMEHTNNAIAVRNRLRIVRGEVEAFISARVGERETPLQILSIAAGSSRGVLEAIAGIAETDCHVHLRMVDLSRIALADGAALAAALGISALVSAVRAHYRSFARYLEPGYAPDLVEIVGLLDYVDDASAVALLGTLRTRAAAGGQVIYANIGDNDERAFVHTVVGWPPMTYRTGEALADLARRAGFERVRVIREPTQVYTLIVAECG